MNRSDTHGVERWLTGVIVLLALPVHITGLASPSIYRDPAVLLPQNLATDVVTLGVGIPLLALAAFWSWRGSLRGRLLWLGAVAFLVYDYGMYALAVRWNPLFLIYVALLGLSVFALIVGLTGTDPAHARAAFAARAPVRSVAAYLIAVAVIAAAMWLAEEGRALLSGTIPASVTEFETPTNVVHVFDLGVVLPAMVLAAVLLVRGRPWGYVLAPVLLVKATTLGLWVAAMIWFSARAGFAVPAAYTAFFVVFAAIGAWLGWRFFTARDGLAPRVTPRFRSAAMARPTGATRTDVGS
jgi:hypothetical protein